MKRPSHLVGLIKRNSAFNRKLTPSEKDPLEVFRDPLFNASLLPGLAFL